jgi:hypothetical protein
MRQFIMTVMALVAFGTMVATAQAENNPSRTARAAHSTCTGLKLACLSSGCFLCLSHRYLADHRFCTNPPGPEECEARIEQQQPYNEKSRSFYWEHCMKTDGSRASEANAVKSWCNEIGDFQPRRGEQRGRTNA